MKQFNPLPWFLHVCSTSLLKTQWEKEKLLATSNLLLFPQCFLPFYGPFCHFHRIQNCRLKTLLFWMSLKFVVWERVKEDALTRKEEVLNLSTTENVVRTNLS